jgi:serine/threonine protein phosphatase PrpC
MDNMINFDYYTDIGTRKNNEDYVDVCAKDEKYLFIVADGLGGHDDGEIASQFCVKHIVNRFNESTDFNLNEAIQEANLRLLDLQLQQKSKMQTTIAAVYIDRKHVTISHVGDSRIYAFRDTGIVYQSADHSVAQTAVLVGEITKEEIRTHCDRNKLTQTIGARETVKIDSVEVFTDSIDSIILCTDGFWELITEKVMIDKKNTDPQKWLDDMVCVLKLQKNIEKDNNTALIVTLN